MSLAEAFLTFPSIVPEEVCRDFAKASQLEWLDTNHTGGFAMGTVAGVNTRRYHALLLASLNPPADRYSILPRVEETVVLTDASFELATVQYPGAIHPQGFGLLTQFRIDPFPVWQYRLGDSVFEKSVCLLDKRQAVLVRYTASRVCRLAVRVFLAFRDYHSLTHQNSSFCATAAQLDGMLSFKPYADLPSVAFQHNAVSFTPDESWFLNQEYLREQDRGLDFLEDLCSPGVLTFDVTPGQPAWFVATVDQNPPVPDIEALLATEAQRRQFPSPLGRALDLFRVTRKDGQPTLLAGYPWFTDWSRDTLISLPALSTTGFPSSEARAILDMLLRERQQGVLPNRFSDRQSIPEYNTVDGSLGFFVAAWDYVKKTNDLAFLRETLLPAATDIIDWHIRGTFYNIKVDPADHLLYAGERGSQLTWMDAKIGDHVVTPRVGKPVEINALWYNALRITAEWAATLGQAERSQELIRQAELVQESFNHFFWNEARGCLYDVLAPAGPDASLRPNQIFALSLPFPLLDRGQAKSVVTTVIDNLLTPRGLRTLDPLDPDYRPRFEGDMAARDQAYHQGTVWPWLIGPFVAAHRYAFGETPETIRFHKALLKALGAEFSACCLGSLSEVYDAEDPQRPGGCPAQLWSVAQYILALETLPK